MNYRFLISVFCAVGASTAMAQSESADTAKTRNLDEVVVEGRTQRVIDNGVEYMPSKKAKKAAIDATHLLSLMNIPQLDVTPGSTAVKTFTGKDVAVFIDFKEATNEDLQGMRPEDVLRVEVMQYPQDPRFQSKENVVNFIMRKYDWGGYTKLTATGNTLNFEHGEAMLYSKFVKKNWTFDANATGTLSLNKKYHSYSEETFRDINIGNRHFDEITRTTKSGDNYLRQGNRQTASFRAIYQTNTAQVSHTISYFRSGNPKTRNLSTVNFSDNVFDASSSLSLESGQTIYPSINGNYYFSLPKGNSLFVDWSFAYGSTLRNSSYRLGELSPIINNNSEKSYSPVFILQYSKAFSHNNTLRTSLISFTSIYNTDYEGSYSGMQKLLSSENMLFLEYMQNWKCGLSLFSRVGISYVLGRVDGANTLNQWNPRLGLQLEYKINDKNSASVSGWWGNNHPTPASANSAIVQRNELLWLQGNPDLRNTTFITGMASYTYMPINKLSISANFHYDGFLNKTAHYYFSRPGYDGLIRKEINSGDYHCFSGYITAALNLFNNSLSLRATGMAERLITTGIDGQSMNVVTANVQANYFIKNFSFTLWYKTPQKYLDAFGNGVRKSFKSTYGFQMNFSAGDFKASLRFSNWFDEYKFRTDFDSARYSSNGWEWSGDLARSLQLTLSYTIPYGKKVNSNNEIRTSTNTNSAILK